MDSAESDGSSLYMCFRCYQLYSSLEEVLSHQLTSHPDDSGEEEAASGAAPPGMVTELYQCPCGLLAATLDELLWHQQHSACGQPSQNPEPPAPGPAQQHSPAQAPPPDHQVHPSLQAQPRRDAERQNPASRSRAQPSGANSSGPLIRYQCGECKVPLESLSMWQHHRKQGCGPGPGQGQEGEGGRGRADHTVALVSRDHSYLTRAGEVEGEAAPGAGPAQPHAALEQNQGTLPQGGQQTRVCPEPAEPEARPESRSAGGRPGQSFLCVDCGSGFGSEPALASHRRDQHGLQGALHTCAVCGQTFMSTTKFLYHRREHRAGGRGPAGGAGQGQGQGQREGEEQPGRAAQEEDQGPLLVIEGQALGGSGGVLYLVPSEQQGSPEAARRAPVEEAGESALAPEEATAPAGGDAERRRARRHPPRLLRRKRAPPGSPRGDPPPALAPRAAPAPAHVCPHCGRGFRRRCHLRTHVFSHTGERLFPCETCGKAFSCQSNLSRHRLTHSGHKPYGCQRCGKRFTQSGTLKQHRIAHAIADARRAAQERGEGGEAGPAQEDSLLPYSCADCPAAFKTQTCLLIHRHSHTGQYPFPCQLCDQSFLRRKHLQLHMLAHQDRTPLSCPHCDALFVTQSSLDGHTARCRRAREGSGAVKGRAAAALKCPFCSHRCASQERLELHQLSHAGLPSLRCPRPPCRRRFATQGALEHHLHTHGPAPQRPFHCEHCGKDFTTASSLSVHLRIHTGERPYQCSQCGKRFRQIPHLRDHERLHSGTRPFACSLCGKSFVLAARLAEHARTHSGEKPYSCPVCSRAFRSLSNLGKHRKTHARGADTGGPGGGAAAERGPRRAARPRAREPAPTGAPGPEGEAAVRTILLVQAAPPALESSGMPAGEGAAPCVPPAPAPLVFLQPSLPDSSSVEGQGAGLLPIMQHNIEYVIEETV